jgi:phage anti-repressor protein
MDNLLTLFDKTKTIDIVELIEKNPITKLSQTYRHKLINKIKHTFTTEEQKMFLSSFYCYLNYKPNEFIISLDQIWKWIGFSQKARAKELLEKSFIETEDYVFKNKIQHESEEKFRGGQNREIILLTVSTFKKFCIMASTKKSGEIHEYYIKLEEMLHEIIDEESNELRQQLSDTNYLLNKSQDVLLQQQNKINKLLNRRYSNEKSGDIVYIYKDNLDDPNSMIKIGHSKNIRKREKAYSTMSKIGGIAFVARCLNSELTEKTIHHVLNQYRLRPKEEWFEYPADKAVKVIKDVINFLDRPIFIDEQKEITQPSNDTIELVTELSSLIHKQKLDKPITEENKKEDVIEPENSDKESMEENEDELLTNHLQKTVEKITNMPTLDNIHNPLNFQKFLEECFILDEHSFCIKSELKQAHRVWAHGRITIAQTNDLTKFFQDRFNTSTEIINDEKRNIYRGLDLKPLTFIKPINIDYGLFISENCGINYSYRISYTDFFDTFIEWKKKLEPKYKLTSDYRKEIQNYLESTFAGGRVYCNENNKASFPHGIWGIGLESKNFGIKVERFKQSKSIAQYENDNVIKIFDNMSIASRELNIPFSSVSYACRWNKKIGNYYFKIVEK